MRISFAMEALALAFAAVVPKSPMWAERFGLLMGLARDVTDTNDRLRAIKAQSMALAAIWQ
jgi:hypothetical protein